MLLHIRQDNGPAKITMAVSANSVRALGVLFGRQVFGGRPGHSLANT